LPGAAGSRLNVELNAQKIATRQKLILIPAKNLPGKIVCLKGKRANAWSQLDLIRTSKTENEILSHSK
jgi:hypothetical protein